MWDEAMNQPFYRIDENGKIELLPLKWPDSLRHKKSAEKRKFIKPDLQFDFPCPEWPKSSSKKGKFEKAPVRKELFRGQKVERKLLFSPKTKIVTSSPLLPLNDAENAPIILHTPKKISPNSMEFEMLEQQCATVRKLNTIVENVDDDELDLRSEVVRIMLEDKKDMDAIKIKLREYESRHEERLTRILNILDGKKTMDKENIISPKLNGKSDLRKATLSKNLSKKIVYDSPRTTEGLKMFNHLTVKVNKQVSTPKTKGLNLSNTLYKQCLLLQHTPMH